MAFQLQGNAGTVAEVQGTTFRALNTFKCPVDYGALGFYRLSMQSGTIGASLAADGEVFQFRWPDATRFALVYKVVVVATYVVVGAAAVLTPGLQIKVARAWTVAGSGGTRATLTGNNAKLRTSMGTSLVNDAGIATTAALTLGTKTLDTNGIGNVEVNAGNPATTGMPNQLIPRTALLDADGEGQMPLVCAQNEGFIISPPVAWPATLTWRLNVGVVWAEVASF